ncbi:DUF397 domain-containing protein [Streptomyces sp. NPDC054802]
MRGLQEVPLPRPLRRGGGGGGDGGDCVEVATAWRKSTYSGGSGGNCLEVADGHPDVVPVRDSKDPYGPKFAFRPGAWSAFVTDLKRN